MSGDSHVEDAQEFVGTCDMGWCDRLTVALILTSEGWRSSCAVCALSALATKQASGIPPEMEKDCCRTPRDEPGHAVACGTSEVLDA